MHILHGGKKFSTVVTVTVTVTVTCNALPGAAGFGSNAGTGTYSTLTACPPLHTQVTGDDGLNYSEHKCNDDSQAKPPAVYPAPYHTYTYTQRRRLAVLSHHPFADDFRRVRGVRDEARARHVRRQRRAA